MWLCTLNHLGTQEGQAGEQQFKVIFSYVASCPGLHESLGQTDRQADRQEKECERDVVAQAWNPALCEPCRI